MAKAKSDVDAVPLDQAVEEAPQLYYSPSEKGFYGSDVNKDNIPEDVKPVTEEEYAVLLEAQNNGKMIVPDETGKPVAVDNLPPPTFEELDKDSQVRIMESQITPTMLMEAILSDDGKKALSSLKAQIDDLKK